MRPEYAYHQPNAEQLRVMEAMRERFSALHDAIQAAVPNGRGRSLAFTHLEDAAVWVNKAIIGNSERPPEKAP